MLDRDKPLYETTDAELRDDADREKFLQKLERAKEFEDACESQGLPRSCPVERFVEHHRGNASFATGLECVGEIQELHTQVEKLARQLAVRGVLPPKMPLFPERDGIGVMEWSTDEIVAAWIEYVGVEQDKEEPNES